MRLAIKWFCIVTLAAMLLSGVAAAQTAKKQVSISFLHNSAENIGVDLDADTPGLQVNEAPDSRGNPTRIDYLVNLSALPAGGETLTVTVTASGKAANRDDLTIPSGDFSRTFTFSGADTDTSKPSGAILLRDDNTTEGAEDFTFTITAISDTANYEISDTNNAVRGAILPSDLPAGGPATEAMIVITIPHPLDTVILPDIARTMIEQQTDAIEWRIRRAGESSAGSFNPQSAPTGSDFVLPLSADNGGAVVGRSTVTFWGRGDYRDLDSKSGDTEWEGDLFSAYLGLDTHLRPDLLAGFMVSHSEADIEYEVSSAAGLQKGDYELDMTSVHPYLNWSTLGGRLNLWATVDDGEGDLKITPDEDTAVTSGVNMQTVGVGGNGLLLKHGDSELRLKAEAFDVQVEVEGSDGNGASLELLELKVETNHWRIALEARQPRMLASGARFTPGIEVGMLRQTGDGYTGNSTEVSGELHYQRSIARGLMLEGLVRVLSEHGSDNDYTEWGIGGGVRREAGADGQGLSLSLSPGYGNPADGVQEIWRNSLLGDASTTGRRDRHARLNARVGYGLPASAMGDYWPMFGGGVLTLYNEISLGERERNYRLGLQWEWGKLLALDLFAKRGEEYHEAINHSVLLEGEVRF